MARKGPVPTETEIAWWGYLIVALAIVLVIIVGVIVWHVVALAPLVPN